MLLLLVLPVQTLTLRLMLVQLLLEKLRLLLMVSTFNYIDFNCVLNFIAFVNFI